MQHNRTHLILIFKIVKLSTYYLILSNTSIEMLGMRSGGKVQASSSEILDQSWVQYS